MHFQKNDRFFFSCTEYVETISLEDRRIVNEEYYLMWNIIKQFVCRNSSMNWGKTSENVAILFIMTMPLHSTSNNWLIEWRKHRVNVSLSVFTWLIDMTFFDRQFQTQNAVEAYQIHVSRNQLHSGQIWTYAKVYLKIIYEYIRKTFLFL